MRRLILLASLLAALTLGACAPRPPLDVAARPAIPAPPADLAACFARAFPEIPERAFGRAEAVWIIANAKLVDRAKSACGERALAWIETVRVEYGRH